MQMAIENRHSDQIVKKNAHYSVEFFHVYTDEEIGLVQIKSLEYLKSVQDACKGMDMSSIVFVDNYNPTIHTLSSKEVLAYLGEADATPDYWAFEADMTSNAKRFLASVTDQRLRRSYERYIEQHSKVPCSLLTATWYLTRLGVFDADMIKSPKGEAYRAADRLINILPTGYKTVEKRAHELITKSPYSHYADNIQDLFYEVDAGRAIDLF